MCCLWLKLTFTKVKIVEGADNFIKTKQYNIKINNLHIYIYMKKLNSQM